MPNRSPTIRIAPLLPAIIVAVSWILSSVSVVAANNEMVEGLIQGRRVEGMLIGPSRQYAQLLGRDGRLWPLDPGQASEFKSVSSSFRPYPPSEFRTVLLRELGNNYEVSGTTHYLVAHPRGQRSKWADRFEQLYRSFIHYFSVRGLQPTNPAFPLVGIVCKDRNDFNRLAAAQGGMSSRIVGYYGLASNRITLYDMGGDNDSANWQRNAAVLIHEATHQIASNAGIHNRFAPTPLWVAEGLATSFEAPGVYDSHSYTSQADRVNRDRLTAFRKDVAPHHRPEMISSMVASDDAFRTNPETAYAEAWALTFYLIETEPRKYAQYLKRTASRPIFQKYTPAQRTADFVAVFGGDWRMIEARFLRFMASVK